MTSNWYLVLMFVLVVVGIALGLGLAFTINQVTDGAVMEFGGGLGTIVVLFGSCTLGVMAMYFIGSQIDKFVRGRQSGPEAKTYDQKVRVARKTRKKK